MESIDARIRRSNYFMPRRALRKGGFPDTEIRRALADHTIFRVRQGWYSVPDAPPAGVLAVRVGGRLTSISALESYGLRVPRRAELHVATPQTSARLRTPDDRRVLLCADDPVHIHWDDRATPRGTIWRVSIDDALLAVLIEEGRDVAVACASAIMRHKAWNTARMDDVFRRAPERVQAWRSLVSSLDDSHGETFFRLWIMDVGIAFTQQVSIPGVGRFDFKVGQHSYVEIDGAQHDSKWTGESTSSWEKDHDWDTKMAITGNRVLRFTYRQLYAEWPRVMLALDRALDDDRALSAYRARHPYRVRHPYRGRSVRAARSPQAAGSSGLAPFAHPL